MNEYLKYAGYAVGGVVVVTTGCLVYDKAVKPAWDGWMADDKPKKKKEDKEPENKKKTKKR